MFSPVQHPLWYAAGQKVLPNSGGDVWEGHGDAGHGGGCAAAGGALLSIPGLSLDYRQPPACYVPAHALAVLLRSGAVPAACLLLSGVI